MMMDCPRCGFSQPKDRYCAKCGLDIEHYKAKPEPWWRRLAKNSDFHLTLLAVFMATIAIFLIYKRSEFVSRRVAKFLGAPLSSREAGVPEDAGNSSYAGDEPSRAEDSASSTGRIGPAGGREGLSESLADSGSASSEEKPRAGTATTEPKELEMTFWLVPHQTLMEIVGGGKDVGSGSEGQAFLFVDGGKAAEAIRGGSPLSSGGRSQLSTSPLQSEGRLVIQTPEISEVQFQFGLSVFHSKFENKEVVLTWESRLDLPQVETAQEQAQETPSIQPLMSTVMSGSATLQAQSVIVIAIEPGNRHPRDEVIRKAQEGPWTVFHRDKFQSGASDWVVLLQLK